MIKFIYMYITLGVYLSELNMYVLFVAIAIDKVTRKDWQWDHISKSSVFWGRGHGDVCCCEL